MTAVRVEFPSTGTATSAPMSAAVAARFASGNPYPAGRHHHHSHGGCDPRRGATTCRLLRTSRGDTCGMRRQASARHSRACFRASWAKNPTARKGAGRANAAPPSPFLRPLPSRLLRPSPSRLLRRSCRSTSTRARVHLDAWLLGLWFRRILLGSGHLGAAALGRSFGTQGYWVVKHFCLVTCRVSGRKLKL
jgi:hypothetical protein